MPISTAYKFFIYFLYFLTYTILKVITKETFLVITVGRMRGSPLARYQVELDVQWTSDQPYFDFDTDMDARALARSIAREPWSRKYFKGLRE